jgi:STE24 endopeptidase
MEFAHAHSPMNAIAAVILVFLLLEFTLRLVADVLNLGSTRDESPEALRDGYEPGRYRNAQAYLRARTRLGWCSGAVLLAATLVFWFGGGFGWVDHRVRALGLGPVPSGLVYVGAIALLRAALSLPFRTYSVFVIESRFGFNTTGWKTFFLDGIKAALLSLAIGGPVLSSVLYLFETAGPFSWFYCWVALSFLMLCIQFIAPRWILPLFNTYTPLPAGELRSAIEAYARSVRFPLENIFVMDGSRRSTKSNAFFTGFGRHRRAALFDTLISSHSTSELLAVFAHEVGHFKKHHIAISLVVGVVQTGVYFFLFSRVVSFRELFHAFGVEQPSVYAGLVLFVLLCAPLDFLLGVVLNGWSRRREREADRFAVETTGDRPSLVQALRKLSAHNLSHLTPHPFYVFLNYSHPPLIERIRAIQALP